ncbi:Secretory immunoglobulin A-binding protein EsiB [Pontiella desulfatans]|uniref:Secretory immunoglobulin A-binding protein EsiB n=1 Tax=Pontiella desulfatans TaxID=2750659 RepID=A0A6C2U9I6_PONDE|nr:SEL1-like repeat protein [Pontiella desulfatans]VGO16758.1 Secretory immunoglobulin A-binding protein EsiB [Pontiella desulfatans]
MRIGSMCIMDAATTRCDDCHEKARETQRPGLPVFRASLWPLFRRMEFSLFNRRSNRSRYTTRRVGHPAYMLALLLATSIVHGDADALYRQGAAVFESDPAKACGLFVQAAEQGNVSAMVGAGHCFETGAGAAKDYAKAIAWYEKAVAQNSLKACEGLGRIYASCENPEFHDGEKAVKYAEACVRKNPRNGDALALLAAAYARNFDFGKALESATKASRSVDSIEQAKEIRSKIERLKADEPIPSVATEAWVFEASNRGNLWATVLMAKRYADRKGEAYNPRLAIQMCEKAIGAGKLSLYALAGDVYYFAEGSFLDLDKAAEYYKLALKHDCYEKAKTPVRVRYLKCFEWEAKNCMAAGVRARDGYTYSAEVPSGSDIYGNTTYTTTTVTVQPKPEMAAFYFALARKKGHPDALRMQSTASTGRTPSPRNAYKDAIREADKYREGKDGVKKDPKKALEILQKAFGEEANGLLAYKIGHIYLHTPAIRDLPKAEDWMLKAAELKYGYGCNVISMFYSCNRNAPFHDGAKALRFALMAVELSDSHHEIDTLACAYARTGDFGMAVKTQEKAYGLAKEANGSAKTLEMYAYRLELFRQGKAWAIGMKPKQEEN